MKRTWEKILGILACPSVLLLTITIPVVDPRQSDSESDMESGDEGQFRPTVRLPEDSPTVMAAGDFSSRSERRGDPDASHGVQASERPTQRRPRLDSEIPTAQLESTQATPHRLWHQWLVFVQIFTAPWFVILVAWHNLDTSQSTRSLLILSLSSLVFSLICLAALHLSTRGHTYTQPPDHLRPFLSLLGFLVGICWIASIADEVVSLLKTIGVILNISDSLLGLTIFAVGNSLGDLVADVTVARLGYPVMALSACFGGPMLNILLGIGVGGLYMSLHPPHKLQRQLESHSGSSSFAVSMLAPKETYEISISKTLIISGATLVVILIGLLIVVPLNGWMMDRKIGFGLIALWTVSTVGNVIAEIVA
jgi:solute carrier family 24 (sodium/potassium/calcium exchanger), member 6